MMNAHHALAARAALQRRPRRGRCGRDLGTEARSDASKLPGRGMYQLRQVLVNSIQRQQPLCFIGAVDDGEAGNK
jgi:hypothetical protein